MTKLFLLMIFLFISAACYSQKVFINGREGDRSLTWDDFKGKPEKESSFGAYTYTNFKAIPGSFKFKGDTLVWDQPLEYTLELGKDSWVKKDKRSDTLLQHEEGHFIIGKLLVLELNSRVKAATFMKRDFQTKLNSIVKEVADKYREMEKTYDRETSHSMNRIQQWKWNEFFVKEVKRLKGD